MAPGREDKGDGDQLVLRLRPLLESLEGEEFIVTVEFRKVGGDAGKE